MKPLALLLAATVLLVLIPAALLADQPAPTPPAQQTATPPAKDAPKVDSGDTAWMLTSSGLVLLMVPGLALFYGGMVRRKNVLATMMQSMVCLAVVGVYWIAIGYSLAFGKSIGGFIGFSPELVFLGGINTTDVLPNSGIPVYVHVMFQGMFAIITPALISGAVAERIRFGPYCLFVLLWVTFVYCPLAHWVWALDWYPLNVGTGKEAVGWVGKMNALDFAGGTVVHIAAGFSGLAAILLLRKRLGYPEHAMHPNSMVLALTGAGLLWFGWFGFNGGSAGSSGALAASAFSATQAAAAAAGLSWMLVEWWHKGKPTALGLASGIVAGLVAVTPASGYVFIWGGLVIGLIAGVVCYAAVFLKPIFKYDDSLDAFGVHGVGGFLGAVLTGVFAFKVVNPDFGQDGLLAGNALQVGIQLLAAVAAAVFAFVGSVVLVKAVDLTVGFTTDELSETEGLDHTEHAEAGFDFGPSLDAAPTSASSEPRAATVPPDGAGRFSLVVEGVNNGDLMHIWSDLCRPGSASAEFKAIYPHVTTVQGNRFRFRGGDSAKLRDNLQKLLQEQFKSNIKVHLEG